MIHRVLFSVPIPASELVGLGWGLRIGVSKRLPGEASGPGS